MTNKIIADFKPNNIAKLYDVVRDGFPIGELHIKSLRSSYDSVRQQSEKKYGDLSTNSKVLNQILIRIDYILTKIESWISSNTLHKNTDAEIFLDGLSDRIEELDEILEELNEEE